MQIVLLSREELKRPRRSNREREKGRDCRDSTRGRQGVPVVLSLSSRRQIVASASTRRQFVPVIPGPRRAISEFMRPRSTPQVRGADEEVHNLLDRAAEEHAPVHQGGP